MTNDERRKENGMTCKFCSFFSAEYLECRRHPPVVAGLDCGNAAITRWPGVTSDCWCADGFFADAEGPEREEEDWACTGAGDCDTCQRCEQDDEEQDEVTP